MTETYWEFGESESRIRLFAQTLDYVRALDDPTDELLGFIAGQLREQGWRVTARQLRMMTNGPQGIQG